MQSKLINLDGTHQEHTVSDYMILGKDPGCQLVLNHDGVSERHAKIEFKNGNYFIKDLQSGAGVFVNQTQILEAQLHDGDEISLGVLKLQFMNDIPQPTEAFPITSKNEIWNSELQNLTFVSRTQFPILLLGPSGTGKDLIAHKIHEKSKRAEGPFISVNCSALTETLVESELFGHIKGSFTGAINDRKGAFETARGGTLFLDEIGDLPYALQSKLLRALENNEIRPVGSDRNIKTDVRIIAATHQNLYDKIREGSFRSDLFYRLNVVNVTPPSLVDRMEDFDEILYGFARTLRVRFSFGAIQRMKKHTWPGNIRELRNLVSRASALHPKKTIDETIIESLFDKITFVSKSGQVISQNPTPTMPVIKEIEKQMILKRLSANQGNQKRTAADLGMPKSTLHDRLKYYNIDASSFKV